MNSCVVTKMLKSAKEASLEGSRAQGVKFHLIDPEMHFGLQVGYIQKKMGSKKLGSGKKSEQKTPRLISFNLFLIQSSEGTERKAFLFLQDNTCPLPLLKFLTKL